MQEFSLCVTLYMGVYVKIWDMENNPFYLLLELVYRQQRIIDIPIAYSSDIGYLYIASYLQIDLKDQIVI